jgi:hypothetical protein
MGEADAAGPMLFTTTGEIHPHEAKAAAAKINNLASRFMPDIPWDWLNAPAPLVAMFSTPHLQHLEHSRHAWRIRHDQQLAKQPNNPYKRPCAACRVRAAENLSRRAIFPSDTNASGASIRYTKADKSGQLCHV